LFICILLLQWFISAQKGTLPEVLLSMKVKDISPSNSLSAKTKTKTESALKTQKYRSNKIKNQRFYCKVIKRHTQFF
jgi:hypothetical protein